MVTQSTFGHLTNGSGRLATAFDHFISRQVFSLDLRVPQLAIIDLWKKYPSSHKLQRNRVILIIRS